MRIRSFLFFLGCSGVLTAAVTPATKAGALYPATSEWTRAGVTGGLSSPAPIVSTLRPGDDLQAAVDAAAGSGGVVLLTEGDYPLRETLHLRSGVILRGADRVTTRLLLQMRGARPAAGAIDDPSAWTNGVTLAAIERAGLEELTVIYDPALPPPPDPRRTKQAYADNPDGRHDLHVVSVAMISTRECWLANSFILNSGSHPLVIADSRQVTVDGVVIEGAYNRGPGSGMLNLIRTTAILLSGLRARDINTFMLHGGAAGAPSRHNVIANSRFDLDVRVHGAGTTDNLFENCAIAVPAWLLRPPLSPGNAEAREAPPGPGNLVYLCTITRDFGAGSRAFSMADDPGQVYEVLQAQARDRAPSVTRFGPAPMSGSLRRPQ